MKVSTMAGDMLAVIMHAIGGECAWSHHELRHGSQAVGACLESWLHG
jgi:hypothetical protein